MFRLSYWFLPLFAGLAWLGMSMVNRFTRKKTEAETATRQAPLQACWATGCNKVDRASNPCPQGKASPSFRILAPDPSSPCSLPEARPWLSSLTRRSSRNDGFGTERV